MIKISGCQPRPSNSPHPNPNEHLLDTPEKFQSMEAPPWIRLGTDPSRHGDRTFGGVWHQGVGDRSFEY